MKLSSLRAPFTKLSKNIENRRLEKQEQRLNRLVNLENVENADAHTELFRNREYLAKYADDKGVRFTFYSLPNGQMNIMVTKNSKKATTDATVRIGTINSNTKETETVERPIKRMLEDKDGCNYQSNCPEQHDDDFLRRVYRNAETLIYRLNNNK